MPAQRNRSNALRRAAAERDETLDKTQDSSLRYRASAMSSNAANAKSLSFPTARSPCCAAEMTRVANSSLVAGVGSPAARQASSYAAVNNFTVSGSKAALCISRTGARDLVAQELGLLLLIKRDVRVLTVSGDDLTDTSDPSRVMMRQIAGSFAQYEKTRLVTKLRSARERLREANGKCEGPQVVRRT